MVAVCWPSSVTLGPRAVLRIRFRCRPLFPPSPRSSAGRDLNPFFNRIKRKKSSQSRRTLPVEMIPDTETVCLTSEAAVRSTDVYRKIKNGPEGETASVTAWTRYQQLVAIVESRGGKFSRKSMIEAIFRGNDLAYASH